MKNKYRPNRNITNSLFKSIKDLIEISKHAPEDLRKSMSDREFKKDFATIRIQMPRRLGNTTLAKKLLEDSKSTVYVTAASNCKELDREYRGRCFSLINLDRRLRGVDFDILIADCASCIPDKDIDTIYNMPAKIFVFLG